MFFPHAAENNMDNNMDWRFQRGCTIKHRRIWQEIYKMDQWAGMKIQVPIQADVRFSSYHHGKTATKDQTASFLLTPETLWYIVPWCSYHPPVDSDATLGRKRNGKPPINWVSLKLTDLSSNINRLGLCIEIRYIYRGIKSYFNIWVYCLIFHTN